MAQRPYQFRHRPAKLDKYSCERAGPRYSGQDEKRYYHQVIPISSTGAPRYTQASELYPTRSSSSDGGEQSYRYKPGGSSSLLSDTSSPTSSSNRPHSPASHAVKIPVRHMGSSMGRTDSPPGASSLKFCRSAESLAAANSPTSHEYRRLSSSSRPSIPSSSNDQEAEVDALTSKLMESLEQNRPVGGSLESTTGGSMKRGGTYPSPSSQIGRLQQHIGFTSPTNNGRGSPLTMGSCSTPPPTLSQGSPNPDSPNGSAIFFSSSSPNDSCFRCRRSLQPTSIVGKGTGESAPVVSLTGALSVRLHSACFTCYRCAKPLSQDGYYHTLHRLLCPSCVQQGGGGGVDQCSECHRPIGDRVVYPLGQPYHPNCFVCVVCNQRLDGKPFTVDVHRKFHCIEDFHRKYAPKCATCKRPIAPQPGSSESRRVVRGDDNFHVECFGVQSIVDPMRPQQQKPVGLAKG